MAWYRILQYLIIQLVCCVHYDIVMNNNAFTVFSFYWP
jgi:hypothetical protein